MHVHTATVVANQRFRHECSGLAVAVGNILDDVLEVQNFVGLLHQRVERHANFALAGSSHFVVVYFDFLTHFFQSQTHCRTHIMQ